MKLNLALSILLAGLSVSFPSTAGLFFCFLRRRERVAQAEVGEPAWCGLMQSFFGKYKAMQTTIKSILGSAALLFFTVFSVLAGAQANGPEVGQESPNLIGRTLDGDQPFRLSVDKGKPKVINFFWVQCVPCKQEMPELAALEKRYPKVKFISVHTQDEPRAAIENFIASIPATPSTILLTNGRVQESFKYLGLPHTVVLDRNNVVLTNLAGYTPENMAQLGQMLEDLSRAK